MKTVPYSVAERASALVVAVALIFAASVRADTLLSQKTTPVMVTFGVRSLSPDTVVDNQTAFVSQDIMLPDVVCNACEGVNTRWESEWLTSGVKYLTNVSQKPRGWYVFASGLGGIGISIKTKAGGQAQQTIKGDGANAGVSADLSVGLVRLAQDTGAGLAALPPAQFRRLTTFYDDGGRVLYAQEDTVQVSADLRVPTCTSSTGGLRFQMPEISQVWLKRNVAAGDYTDSVSSPPQLIVANCSENTRNLRVRFIAAGPVSDSTQGKSTILVGHDAQTGLETGTGYLMTYSAEGFGKHREGVVQWDRFSPLVLTNPQPTDSGDALTRGITVSLQAFYARPENNLVVSAGQIEAKGIYQVSYD